MLKFEGLKDKLIQFRQFLREVKVELAKVSWPTSKDTVSSTTVVLIFVIFMGIFFGIADFLFSKLMGYFIKGF